MPEVPVETPAATDATGAQEAGEARLDYVRADPRQKEEVARVGSVSCLNEIPAAVAYMRRIGANATPDDFRRATIRREADGYPKTVGSAQFAADGTVTVDGEAEPPTPAEQEAIAAAFKNVTFPTLVMLTAIADPP